MSLPTWVVGPWTSGTCPGNFGSFLRPAPKDFSAIEPAAEASFVRAGIKSCWLIKCWTSKTTNHSFWLTHEWPWWLYAEKSTLRSTMIYSFSFCHKKTFPNNQCLCVIFGETFFWRSARSRNLKSLKVKSHLRPLNQHKTYKIHPPQPRPPHSV